MADEKKETADVQDAQANAEDQDKTANKEETKDVVEATSVEVQDTVGALSLESLSELRTDHPDIKPGNVIRVFYRVIEGGKERVQVFEGTVIAMKNRGIARTITVRKTSFGIAVERIFPLNSKLVQKIELKKRQKVRRAKLYYLRNLKGKAARLKELR